MSFTVERALQRIQAEHPGEHLPMEKFLRAIHDEEYDAGPLFRLPTGTCAPFRVGADFSDED